MSRDPLDGNQFDPKSLHKYLYADGDPINGMDPQRREELIEYAAFVAHNALEGTVFGVPVGKRESKAWTDIAELPTATISNSPTNLTGEGIDVS